MHLCFVRKLCLGLSTGVWLGKLGFGISLGHKIQWVTLGQLFSPSLILKNGDDYTGKGKTALNSLVEKQLWILFTVCLSHWEAGSWGRSRGWKRWGVHDVCVWEIYKDTVLSFHSPVFPQCCLCPWSRCIMGGGTGKWSSYSWDPITSGRQKNQVHPQNDCSILCLL